MQNQPRGAFICCHSYQDTEGKWEANLPSALEPFCVMLGGGGGLLLIFWSHIQYTICSDRSAKNSGSYCRAVHCIQGSVCAMRARETYRGVGRVGSGGLWVIKRAVQHSVPVSAVFVSGEGRGSGSGTLTHTRLVQSTVALPQGERG